MFHGTATSGNITLVDHSVTYQFRVSAGITDSETNTVNEGELSTITESTTLFIPEPGKEPHVTDELVTCNSMIM